MGRNLRVAQVLDDEIEHLAFPDGKRRLILFAGPMYLPPVL